MLKSVRVPAAFGGPFERAESFVEKSFSDIQRRPEDGTLHISGDRYILVRAESLYLAWMDALDDAFGAETAREFVYNTAREIGRNDSRTFAERLQLKEPIDRLSSGPVHFAHAGWALVEILDDAAPAPDASFFLHYHHPNTFESEVIRSKGRVSDGPGCFFSAGYSAGWCSEAFGLELHGRELSCVARGDAVCEFIMAPAERLDAHEERVRAARSG